MTSIRERIAAFINPNYLVDGSPNYLSPVTVKVDDSAGWTQHTGRPHERDWSEMQSLYEDALVAYRKNPIAWRIVATTTNYILGDRIIVSSPRRDLNRFIASFWNHPKNLMDLRLAPMSDELARAGDLFVALFRNPQDGMSYIRFVTKDRIQKIESAENDWETELIYYETQETGEPRAWYSLAHPGSHRSRRSYVALFGQPAVRCVTG